MNKLLLYLLISIFPSCSLERRLLMPPNLSNNNIHKRILCCRPIRKSGPAMYITEINNKIIVHNYGHGGGGWSLAPGAATYLMDKLDNKLKNLKINKNEPITIIGAGIIGLFSAYRLIELGYRNIKIVAENFNNLASNHAGGLWSPFHIGDISNMEGLISKIGIDSYKFYLNTIKEDNHKFKGGAKLMSSYFINKETVGLDIFIGTILKQPKKILADFGNGTKRKMYVYDDTLLINTPFMMKKLGEITKEFCIYKKSKVNSFSEIKDKIIINCSGYGAKALCKDDDLISMQGHLLVLKNQNPKHLNYMLTVPFEKGIVNGFKVKRLYYIIPRHDEGTPISQIGVIGGTLVEGAEEKDTNYEEFDKIILRAQNFYGIKK